MLPVLAVLVVVSSLVSSIHQQSPGLRKQASSLCMFHLSLSLSSSGSLALYRATLLLRPLDDKHSNLYSALRLTASVIRPRLDVFEQFLPKFRRRGRPVDVPIATLRLGLLSVAHDDFRDAGFFLLRPPILRPGLSAQRDFSRG